LLYIKSQSDEALKILRKANDELLEKEAETNKEITSLQSSIENMQKSITDLDTQL